MLVTLAAIGAVLFIGFSNFLGPLMTRRTPILTVVVASQALPVLVLGVWLAAFTVPLPGRGFLLSAVAIGLLTAVATALAFRAGQIGNIGLVAVILALAALIPVIAGILGGDRPSLFQWLGIALAAGGTGLTLLAGGLDEGEGVDDRPEVHLPAGMPVGAGAVPAQPPPVVLTAIKRAGGNWPLMAVGAAIGFGVFMFIFAELSKQNLVWATFLTRSSVVASVLIVIVVTGQPLLAPGSKRRQLLPLPLLSLILTLSIMCFGYAASSMLTITSALTAFAPVVAVALSWVILKERLSRPQMLGVVITICGLVLIAV